MGKAPKVNTHSHLILLLASNFLLFSVRTISRINHAPEAELKSEGPLRSTYPRLGRVRKRKSLLSALYAGSKQVLCKTFPSFHLQTSFVIIFPKYLYQTKLHTVIYHFIMRQLNNISKHLLSTRHRA